MKGVFVRFGSTDRLATTSQVLELSMLGQRRSFSSELFKQNNVPIEIEDMEITKFVNTINSQKEKKITIDKQIEWDLIEMTFDKYYATNGFMLLTSNPFGYCYVKIAHFAGTNKSNMVHEEVIKGNIIEQYNNVVDYVLTSLTEGYTFKKVRKQTYDIPEEVVREIVANSIVHRDYQDEHPIRIEIYNDRIEFFSPGSLFDGMQLEDMLRGVSKLRNKNIAEVFYFIGFIEKWGSGIQRANQYLLENNQNEMIIDAENIHGVTVVVEFDKAKTDTKITAPVKIAFNSEEIIKYYKEPGQFTRRQIEEDFGVTIHKARRQIEEMVQNEIILKKGKGSATYYKIKLD